MFRRKVRLIGDEMLHRYGACRDRWSARLLCLAGGVPHQRWATPRHGPRSWGCCFAITEPDGAANGEGCRMTRTPHGGIALLRPQAGQCRGMRAKKPEALEEAKSSRKQGGRKPSQRRVAAGE